MKNLAILVKAQIFLMLLGIFSACNKSSDADSEFCIQEPHPIVIYLQPFDNFTEVEIKSITDMFYRNDSMGVGYRVDVLEPIQLNDSLKNYDKTRYRAEKILRSLDPGKEFECVIGLTRKDISTTKGNYPDWGIQGLSFRGKHVAVVSTFRLSNVSDLGKVVYHEFCHAYYNLPHCPDDNPNCIITDAKGRPYWANKERLCLKCQIEAARELKN